MNWTSRLTRFCRQRVLFSPAYAVAASATPPAVAPALSLRSLLRPCSLSSSRLFSSLLNQSRQSSSLLANQVSTSRQGASSAGLTPIALCVGFVVMAAAKEEEEDSLVMEVKKAKLNEVRENYTLAEEHYHAALRINEEQQKAGKSDEMKAMSHRAWILDAMANMAMNERKPYKAEKLFKEVIQLLIQMGAPETSPPVLEISVKLANLFAIMEESEKRQQAEVGYKFAIDSQKKTLEQLEKLVQDGQECLITAVKDAKALLGWAHQSYAFYLLDERRKEEGVAEMHHSIDIARSVYGEDSESFATMLNDSASAMADKNLFEEATALLEKSLDMGKGKGWEAEAAFRINLGIIAIHRKLYADAEKYCQSGMELAVKMKSADGVEEAARCLTELKKALSGAGKESDSPPTQCLGGS